MSRKEKEKEFFAHHMDKFRKAQIADPFFTIKTAFFKKGKASSDLFKLTARTPRL